MIHICSSHIHTCTARTHLAHSNAKEEDVHVRPLTTVERTSCMCVLMYCIPEVRIIDIIPSIMHTWADLSFQRMPASSLPPLASSRCASCRASLCACSRAHDTIVHTHVRWLIPEPRPQAPSGELSRSVTHVHQHTHTHTSTYTHTRTQTHTHTHTHTHTIFCTYLHIRVGMRACASSADSWALHDDCRYDTTFTETPFPWRPATQSRVDGLLSLWS